MNGLGRWAAATARLVWLQGKIGYNQRPVCYCLAIGNTAWYLPRQRFHLFLATLPLRFKRHWPS
jgi:hypothetical protein